MAKLKIREHDTVTLRVGRVGLPAGSKGTIVHVYGKGIAYEVEFIKEDGTATIEIAEGKELSNENN